MGCDGCANTILYILVVTVAKFVVELYSHFLEERSKGHCGTGEG